MSHQTGITANDELLQFFGTCKNNPTMRAISVTIENEQLALGKHGKSYGNWESDYDKTILPLLNDQQPLYILYRLDNLSHGSYDWILICWSPDDSPVRQKMLFASTKATLKKDFGGGQIVEEIFASVKEEASLEGLKKHRLSDAAPAPLTMREEEMKEIQKLEVGVDVSVDSRHQTLAGVAFPLTRTATEALKTFGQGKLQYVQLKIDMDSEEINLAKKIPKCEVSELGLCIPEDSARYHLYRFDHDYEGDYYHSVLFIYSMPGYACPIKERMLYSSSKNPITDYIETTLNIGLTKKLEISEGSELILDYLLDEIHPKQNLHRPKFSKPKGPSNRGAKRITKNPHDVK